MKVWFPALKVNTGADVFVSNLAAGLRRQEVPVTVTWFPRFAEFFPALLRWAMPPLNTDIIHVGSGYGFPFCGRGVPVVTTVFHWVHGADFAPRRSLLQSVYHRLLRRFEERSLRAATAVTTISQYSARQLTSAFPWLHPHVIYPGIDTDFFQPGAARDPDGRFRLLFVGSPSRRKGFDLLPRLAALLGGEFELHYAAGTGYPGVENLKRIGHLSRERLRDEYRRCDALIFPTRYEGFGLVAAEAMACGRPVIASRCTSLPELVQDGATGILCPVDDVAAFAAAARRLQADPQACRRMGRAGRERVLQHFTLSRMTEQYLDLYRSLAVGTGAAGKQGNGVNGT